MEFKYSESKRISENNKWFGEIGAKIIWKNEMENDTRKVK